MWSVEDVKKVIITGATGFIGKWLLKEMLESKNDVTVIVRDKNKIDIDCCDNIHIYEAEYIDYDKLEILSYGYDTFYHLAWEGVSSKDKDKLEIQMININMSIAALNLAKRLGCMRFVGTGTVAEYAYCEKIMDFSQKQIPNDLYGAIKTSVYYILNVLSGKVGIDFIWAVLPSTYGEGRNNNNIITYTIEELLAGRKPLYGNLNQLWDFLYVKEVVRALRLIGERGIPGKVYGIGSGQYKTLKDYVCIIRDIIDPKLELGVGELPQMSQKAYSSCVGIYDLIKDTGFNVEIEFEQGIRNTIEYYKTLSVKGYIKC